MSLDFLLLLLLSCVRFLDPIVNFLFHFFKKIFKVDSLAEILNTTEIDDSVKNLVEKIRNFLSIVYSCIKTGKNEKNLQNRSLENLLLPNNHRGTIKFQSELVNARLFVSFELSSKLKNTVVLYADP